MTARTRRLWLARLEDRCTPATLTGTAFVDANFNGAFDSGETPLANAAISLDINGTGINVLATATNSAGVYSFANVINGVHKLSGALAGYSKVTPNPITVNSFTSGTITANLGFANSAVLAGFVFTDMNANATLDSGERLLPNYTVTLDLNSDGTQDLTTVTDINGLYHFTGVPNGGHKLAVANATITPGQRSVTVVGSQDVGGLGFAVTPAGTLSGTAFADTNATGVKDAAEGGLAGVTINFDFYADGTVDKSFTTAADGVYSFTGIPDGTHNISASRTGFTSTTPGTLGATWVFGQILLPPVPAPSTTPRTPGDPVPVFVPIPTSFGFAQSAIISGYVYGDTNKNGLPNLNEPELANVTVRLDTDNNGSFDLTTVTDIYGRYAFSAVANGQHKVAVTLPSGYTGATLVKTVTISSGVNSPGHAFALTPIDPVRVIGVSTDSSFVNQVNLLNGNGTMKGTFAPFPIGGDTRIATGDVNGDTIEDYAVATGSGRIATVRVIDGATGAELFTTQPYGNNFFGGAFVALGDLTGDGRADLVITPDQTGGPRVRIFTGNGFTQLADFFGIDDVDFRGGARAAVGDLNNDATGDLIVSAGYGGGPRIALFDGKQLTLTGGPKFIGDFFAFEQELRNGAFVAAGDVNGDGYADLIAGAGLGGAPRVTALSGKALVNNQITKLADFFAGGQIMDRSGVKVAVADIDADGKMDIVAGYRSLPTFVPHVAAYAGKSLTPGGAPPAAFDIVPFPGFIGSIYVG